jgi:hypothetical protein
VSFDLMREVWTLELPALEKWVLMAFADEDRETGAGVWPSLETVAAKTGLTTRAVSSNISRLVKAGYLVPISSRAGGRGHSVRYQIDLQRSINHEEASTFTASETTKQTTETTKQTSETTKQTRINHEASSREPIIKPIGEPTKANGEPIGVSPEPWALWPNIRGRVAALNHTAGIWLSSSEAEIAGDAVTVRVPAGGVHFCASLAEPVANLAERSGAGRLAVTFAELRTNGNGRH